MKREEEENSLYLLFLLLHSFEWMDACDILTLSDAHIPLKKKETHTTKHT